MNNLLYLLLSLCLLFAVSCEDDDGSLIQGDVDELYFGYYFGQCGGNCTIIYWAREQELRIDTITDIYGGNLLLGDLGAFPLLSDSLYQLTSGIRDGFPAELLDEEPVIGIPDAYDQGGYFIAIPDGDGYREWRIDTNLDEVPDAVKPFIGRVADLMIVLGWR